MKMFGKTKWYSDLSIVNPPFHIFTRSEKPLPTLRLDGTNNILKRSNLYFNKCFVYLTLSKEWTDSQKFIETLSVSLQTLPLFVIMVHSEDDQGWDDPGSVIFRLHYPTLHLTRKKVGSYLGERRGLELDILISRG